MSGDKDIYLNGDCRVDGTRIPPLSTLCWVSLPRAADGAVLMSSYKKKLPPEVPASAESGPGVRLGSSGLSHFTLCWLLYGVFIYSEIFLHCLPSGELHSKECSFFV